MHQFHIQHALDLGVKNSIPVRALTLLRRWKVFRVPVGQHVSRPVADKHLARRGRSCNLRGRSGVRIGELMGLLRGSWPRWRARPRFSRAGRRGRRGWSIACILKQFVSDARKNRPL